MSRALAVLRPEPGNAATAARIEAQGLAAIRLPLFAVRALAWEPPPSPRYDAVLLTSANAVRYGGPGLAVLRELPALAVGRATAAAAQAAGFAVALTGVGDAATLVAEAQARGFARLLHLAGRERSLPHLPAIDVVAVYASEPLAITPERIEMLAGSVLLVHSVRAARRIAALLDRHGRYRGAIALTALSPAVLAAAGAGWCATAAAALPSDAALIEAARHLAD